MKGKQLSNYKHEPV